MKLKEEKEMEMERLDVVDQENASVFSKQVRVTLDGKPTRSCILPIGAVAERPITTIEGVGATPEGAKVQKAWLDLEVIQCGYCQSGQIMSAAALLASTPQPNDADINAAMSGNICRCGTYVRIRSAIKQAAGSKS